MCLILIFGTAVAYAVIGNLILYGTMRNKGSDIPFFLGGLALLAYMREGPEVRSRRCDLFVLSLILSVLIAVALAALLYPRIWV